jgi:hypothetical protein
MARVISDDLGMIKRLEQIAALVVAAGLAIVSYWLFFSWAQGGGADRRPAVRQSLLPVVSETAAGLAQPAPAGAVFQAVEMVPHLIGGHRQAFSGSDLHDAAQCT